MAGYKPVGSVEDGRRFLNILHEAGGVYVPEYIGRTRYATDALKKPLRSWDETGAADPQTESPRHVDALLGLWLPQTAEVRDIWRWSKAMTPPRSWWPGRYAHHRRMASRVDWSLLSRLERESTYEAG